MFIWKKDLSFDLPEVTANRPDCIIMLAFGQAYKLVGLGAGLETSSIVPGRPNEEIARVMNRCDRNITYRGGLPPILAQWEFAETREFNSSFNRLEAFALLGSRDEYKNIREILEGAKVIMDKNGWTSAVIVAHPWHLSRCQWTAEKLGIRVIHDRLMTEELNEFASVWNDQDEVPDNQRQTICFRNWLWYEFRARVYFWLKGWI